MALAEILSEFLSDVGTAISSKDTKKALLEEKARRAKSADNRRLFETSGLADALQALSAPPVTESPRDPTTGMRAPASPDLQAASDAAERALAGDPSLRGRTVDLSAETTGRLASEQSRAHRLFQAMQEAGIGFAGGEMTAKPKAKSAFELLLESQMAGSLSPKDGEEATGGFVPVRMTKGGVTLTNPQAEAERAAMIQLEKSKAMQRVKNQELTRQFGFIEKDIDAIFTSLGKVPAGRLAGPIAAGKAALGMPGSENVFDYENSKELIMAKIAKAFGGEVGVLTDRDIDRINRAFPPLWMNPRERASRIQWIKDYVQRRVEAYTVETPEEVSETAPGGELSSDESSLLNALESR